jgi:hypothetical protein
MPDSTPTYPSFPSIQRLSSETITITEKIDGTNGLIHVSDDGVVTAGARNGWITPEKDNFGFARWVAEHASELVKLGPGYHYGEWYGSGIQRRYGLTERRFASFEWWRDDLIPIVQKVPVLYQGTWNPGLFDSMVDMLSSAGSVLVPGFMDPEGIVIQFESECARQAKFKKFCKNDLIPKSKQVHK